MAGQTITAVIAADARPFKKGMSNAANSTSTLTGALKGIGTAATAAFATAVVAAGAFLVESVKLADQSRQVSRGLQTAVKNSGAFGKSSDQIAKVTSALDDASAKLGELIGQDDELISGIKRNWLSVPRIAATGIKGINKLATVAADVAAGTGKNFEEVATAFTKAYGDPKGAIAKLLRAGVVLSDQDKKRYQSLIDQGKQTQALAFLTDTLGKKYKGQAEAAASPFARLQVSFQNFQENIGAAFLPIIDKYLPKIQDALKELTLDPEFQKSIDDMATSFGSILESAGKIGGKLLEWKIPQGILTYIDWAIKNLPSIYTLVNFFTTGKWGLDSASSSSAPASFPKISTNSSGQAVTINVNAVSSSAETGKAVANALSNYYRTGGRQVK